MKYLMTNVGITMKSKVDNILLIIITLFIFSFVTRKVYADENINYEQKIY